MSEFLEMIIPVLGVIGFAGANVAYDAMLLDVAQKSELERVSALGFALGYLGGGLLFAVNVIMVLYPQAFGLADKAEAVRLAFLMVAIWWAVFSLPVLMFVHEAPRQAGVKLTAGLRHTWRELRDTWRLLRRLRMAFIFLIAYWFYIDGVDTIVRMAVDYGLSLGFAAESLLTALLITQFVGFPAAIVFGKLGTRIGAKRDAPAYSAIASDIGLAPADILFLSDIEGELDAARSAGMQTLWLVRDAEPDPAAAHRQVKDFDAIPLP